MLHGSKVNACSCYGWGGSYETDAGKRTLSHTDFLLNKQKPLQTERTETKTETTNLPHIMLSEHRYVRAQQPQCHRPLHFRHTVGNQQTWQCLKIIARVKEYKTEAFGQHLSGFILELRRAAFYFTINTRFRPNKQMKGTFMAFIMLNCQILDRPSLSKAAIFLELVFSYDVIFSNTPLIKTWSPDYPITYIFISDFGFCVTILDAWEFMWLLGWSTDLLTEKWSCCIIHYKSLHRF